MDAGWNFVVDDRIVLHNCRMAHSGRLASLAGAVGLAAIAGAHLVWATGSSWPYSDRTELADNIAGRADMPGPRACVTVAAALAAGAVVVAVPGRRGSLVQLAQLGLTAVLFTRGVAGVTRRTRLLVSWDPSDLFVEKDRRLYGPACLVLAALSALSLRNR